MASRRLLKKQVKDISTMLIMGCALNTLRVSEDRKEQLDKLVGDTMDKSAEFVSRISHTEPGNVKGYYKKFHEDFEKWVDDVAKELEKLIS